MDLSVTILIAALAGGMFGAAVGGLMSFVFTGFMVMVGVGVALLGGDFDFLGNVAFGPVFGPHISFAGGAAAAAAAQKFNLVEAGEGKNIAAPLVGLANPVLLLIGAAFGLGGHLLQQLIAGPLGGVDWTDSIALTVGISGIVARVAFGGTGVFGNLTPEAQARGRWVPGGDHVWVAFQQGFGQVAVLATGAGLLFGWVVATGYGVSPEVGGALVTLGFGVSAASLMLPHFGFDGPVTHHMTLPGAVAANQVMMAGFDPVVAIIAGGAFGLIGGLLGEAASRLFLIHGDTHIDPPALAIFPATSLALALGAIL
jgi:hypothetical protein